MKPLTREELPTLPNNAHAIEWPWMLDGVVYKTHGVGFGHESFGPADVPYLKEVVAWLELANGLSSPPPVESEFVPPPGEFSGCRCANCPEKQTPKRKCGCCEDRRLSDKYPESEDEMGSNDEPPTPLASRELPTIDSLGVLRLIHAIVDDWDSDRNAESDLALREIVNILAEPCVAEALKIGEAG